MTRLKKCAQGIWFAAIVGSLIGCDQSDHADGDSDVTRAPVEAEPVVASPRSAQWVALNNQGVAEMGHFDYGGAFETFAKLVEMDPKSAAARINLAIATLNRQSPGDEAEAAQILKSVAVDEPENGRAAYLLGILAFNGGEVEPANAYFRSVVDRHPDDAYANYFLGQTELQLGRADEALALFKTSAQLDPYLRSAWYGQFLASRQAGDREGAKKALATYQQLDLNPRSRLAEIKYSRMGPMAAAMAFRAEASAEPVAQGDVSFDETFWTVPAGDLDPGILSGAVLINSQQRLALLAPNQLVDLTSGEMTTLEMVDGALSSAAWGDLDNDGDTDLVGLVGGEVKAWLAEEKEFRSVEWPVLGDRSDLLIADQDHDGDLDVITVSGDGLVDIINNNGDGSWRVLNLIDRPGEASTWRLAAADVDGDRDMDIVAYSSTESRAFSNQLLWQFKAAGGKGFESMLLVDMNVDGVVERLTATEGEELALLDADADGEWEVLHAGTQDWRILDPGRGDQVLVRGQGQVVAVVQSGPDEAPALMLLSGGELSLTGPGAGRYAQIDFSGKDEMADSMRSNRSGLGTHWVARSGSRWMAATHLKYRTGRGNDLQPVAIGMPDTTVDYLELTWPDGVFQTELDVKAGRQTITETQRQLASCPVVFVHDGDQWQFVTDVLGVGGMGFAVAPGEYAQPRPYESLLIAAPPSDGPLKLMITEPMEETAYIDSVRVAAFDVPSDLGLTLNERMSTDGVHPDGEVVLFDQIFNPSVVNVRGESLTDQVSQVDLVAADPGPIDPRFPGFVAERSQLTLHFDVDLHSLAHPVLLMDGWVEYGYSQTAFAAWQAGVSYEPPTLHAQDSNGNWHEVARHFGYPAGMPRAASYPLDRLPPGPVTALRITTNQEIYFDRLAVVDALPDQPTERTLDLTSAEVRRIGFPRRTDGPQRQPSYDFSQRQPFWDTRYQTGAYTDFGEMTELVAADDGGLAIIGPGDAIELTFDVGHIEPVKPGFVRYYRIQFGGWAKDMDLYTLNGASVGPLPGQKRDLARAADLNKRYNNRFQSGR